MFYLVSTSPRRKKILKSLRIRFRALTPGYEEKNSSKSTPSGLVKKHALAKARSVLEKITAGTVLAADTIVYFRRKIIGKPKSMKEAARILARLQGNWHTVYTGVAIFKIRKGRVGKKVIYCEKTKVHLEKMTRRDILAYFKRVDPLDKAGAYAIQSKRSAIVDSVKGSLSNAVGLPLESFKKYLSMIK